jgi:hypothetical protein
MFKVSKIQSAASATNKHFSHADRVVELKIDAGRHFRLLIPPVQSQLPDALRNEKSRSPDIAHTATRERASKGRRQDPMKHKKELLKGEREQAVWTYC